MERHDSPVIDAHVIDARDAGLPPSAESPAESYENFIDEMEELGLLSDLEDELPPDFSAVFEIGRILADPRSALGRAISPAVALKPHARHEEEQEEEELGPTPEGAQMISVAASEEYEAEFIRTWSDVQFVYAWQHLLPEEVFLRRLANRTLWFPMAKAPTIRAIEEGGDDFKPTPTKQKAYVLLDTSASMSLRHRFSFAKAIVLRFLRQNRRELGEVFLRTFDVDVGPLEEARDPRSYDLLLRRVARRRTLGNGTCLERAILQAAADIRERRGLSGAEILVVTDGAAHVDTPTLIRALGNDVTLHCVKIGSADVFASDRWVDDAIEFERRGETRREQRIMQMRERRDRLKKALAAATDDAIRAGIREGLAECEAERREIAEELRHEYGHEIERIADVWVQVPDLDPASLALTPEQLASLERLVREMTSKLGATPAPTQALKEAALLLSHVALLAAEQLDAATRDRLEALRQSLEKQLGEAIQHHEEHVIDAGLLTSQDQRDLRLLLRRGTTRYSSLWLALLRYFYAWVTRFGRKG